MSAVDRAPNDDTASMMSDATTQPLVKPAVDDDMQRFTAIGRPHQKEVNTWANNIMLGDGGGFASGLPGNLLPQRFTDKSAVTIPIPLKDLESDDESQAPPPAESQKKESWLKRKRAAQAQREGGKGGVMMVKMSRGEYLQYWAKGEDGKYLPDVVEPPGGRKYWVQKMKELNGP